MVETWTFRENVNVQHVLNFFLCIADICDALSEIKNADQSNAGVRGLVSARRISVPLRKLLLDGNGYLLKSCFSDPNLHALKPPVPDQRSVTIVQNFQRPAMTFGWADGKKSTIEIPEYQQRTTIQPLYGICHAQDDEFLIDMPFDYERDPLKFQAWANTKVLEVDGHMFTSKDLLREIANNEGAHIGDGIKLALPNSSSAQFDHQKNLRYKAVNAVKFGTLSYAHLFCIWTGLYLAYRSKGLVDMLPFDTATNAALADMREKITKGPSTMSGRMRMENQTYHGLLIGSDGNLRSDSIGDYSTYLKIP